MTELRTTITAILSKMCEVKKPQRDFLVHTLILFLSIRSRINFLGLERHSKGCYTESTYRNQFEEFFDFAEFNTQLAKEHGSGHFIIGFDPSYIRKSGKSTEQVGKYWSGCSQQMEWGLEAGVFSAIDIDNHTAFHIDAIISPNYKTLQSEQITLVEHYVNAVYWSASYLEKLSRYLAVDAYFTKKEFILPVIERTNLHIIGRWRDDPNFMYLYNGPKRNGKGAPNKYDGKFSIHNPDFSKMTLSYQDEEVRIYDCTVYSPCLKRNIRIAYTVWLNEKGKERIKIYFSTDLNLPAWMIAKYYKARFQEEFLFRDAKQFTGLNHCQARSANKLEYHWNCSLSAINIAKVQFYLSIPKQERKSFSMADAKTICHNQLLLDRFFSIFENNPELQINNPDFSIHNPKVKELITFGCIAA
jgi:hypothetical protein